MHSSESWLSRQRRERRAHDAAPHAVAGLAAQGIPAVRRSDRVSPRANCRVPRSAPPKPQASAALTTPKLLKRKPARESRRHRHHLAHHEKRESRGHAHPHRVRDLDRPALAHRLLRGDRDHVQHEGGDQDGEDRDEGIVRELREPGLEEALGGLEEAAAR